MSVQLMQGDCLERMADIPDGSVDAVICDPPYGAMTELNYREQVSSHGIDSMIWDNAINTESMNNECNRILRTNGALILFSQEPYTSRLITSAHNNLPFSYRMTWLKDNYGHALLAKKAPLNYTEDVCVFFKRHRKHDFEGFHPLRSYARKVLDYIGGTIKSINKDLGHRRAEHFFYVETTQFNLCTERTYNDLIRLYHIDKMPWFREYGDLKAVDREYREALIERMNNATPRRFNLPPGAKYKSNVLQYKKDYSGHHPTQKPVALMEDLIQTYTIEGETVLDFTMGSGTTGVAAANLNRQFIGIELDPEYYRIAMDRIEKEAQ